MNEPTDQKSKEKAAYKPLECEPQNSFVSLNMDESSDQQINQLKANAQTMLAQLKEQEHRKMAQNLLSIRLATEKLNIDLQAQMAAKNTLVDKAQGLKLEGQLLSPVEGLEKIQGVHSSVLDELIDQINTTVDPSLRDKK